MPTVASEFILVFFCLFLALVASNELETPVILSSNAIDYDINALNIPEDVLAHFVFVDKARLTQSELKSIRNLCNIPNHALHRDKSEVKLSGDGFKQADLENMIQKATPNAVYNFETLDNGSICDVLQYSRVKKPDSDNSLWIIAPIASFNDRNLQFTGNGNVVSVSPSTVLGILYTILFLLITVIYLYCLSLIEAPQGFSKREPYAGKVFT